MSTSEREAIITHAIGAQGLLSLRTVRGSVRVRGIDGDEARVEARYATNAPDGTDPNVEGALTVRRLPSELHVEVNETATGVLSALGRLIGGSKPSVDFDVNLPRGATLRLSGVSADLDVSGLRGDMDIRTVSGDVLMDDVSGLVSLQSVSGDTLIQAGSLSLDATTTSGDLSAVATRFERLHIRAVSGDVRLGGEVAEGPGHSVESVSGDLELAPSNGVTVRMSTLSGRIRSELPHRLESHGGRRVAIVGNGAADLGFRTMSGDAAIVGSLRHKGRAAERPGRPPRPERPPRPSLPKLPRLPSLPDRPEPPGRGRGWHFEIGGEKQPDTATAARRPTNPPNELDILRALERGEIDVDEAARQLEGVHRNG